MKNLAFFLLLSFCSHFGHAQVITTAVPFLQYVPSPEGNGMGGISSCVSSTDPFALIMNPGQLGLLSLSQNFGAGFFAPRTQWHSEISTLNMTYRADLAFAGLRINEYLGVPFDLSVGIGYSAIQFDAGEFPLTTNDPSVVQMFRLTERSNAFTFGIGLDYMVKLGIGVNVKRIESTFPVSGPTSISSATARGTAYDYGVIATIPFGRFAPSLMTLDPDFEPFLDLNLGLGRNNVGDELTYIDPAQADPLPRSAYLGVGLEAGVVTRHFGSPWTLISLVVARQSESLLVVRDFLGRTSYLGGFGHISIPHDILVGKSSDNVEVRKGFQVNIVELFSYRKGSFGGMLYPLFRTSGFGIRLAGVWKVLEAINVSVGSDEIVGYIMHHLDIAYNRSTYSSAGNAMDKTTFSGFTLILR